jgi:hypothetical protein
MKNKPEPAILRPSKLSNEISGDYPFYQHLREEKKLELRPYLLGLNTVIQKLEHH